MMEFQIFPLYINPCVYQAYMQEKIRQAPLYKNENTLEFPLNLDWDSLTYRADLFTLIF